VYVYGRGIASVGEAIDDHDGFVMRMIDTRSFDDEWWLRWKSDMMCSAGHTVFGGAWPLW
jgi:hypothetical protein